jgi:hypothetical protein
MTILQARLTRSLTETPASSSSENLGASVAPANARISRSWRCIFNAKDQRVIG